MNDYVNRLFDTYLTGIVNGRGVAVPDDEEEMNWRLFFAHSQDMQGFRADLFTGGQNEAVHPKDRSYVGLRPRWNACSVDLMSDLSRLWENPETRQELVRITASQLPPSEKIMGVRLGLAVLRSGHTRGADVFADALEALTGYKIARKTNKMIRAYIENSYRLQPYGYSLRKYIQSSSPDSSSRHQVF